MAKLKDIARETGLTVSTVSKALNNSHEISGQTTKLVLEKAKALGYMTKKAARKEYKTIGVILPEVRSHYYAELMHVLSREIERHGYTMIAILKKEYVAGIKPYVERILKYDLDGLFVSCDSSLSEDCCDRLYSSGVPTLLITDVDLPYRFDSIYMKAASGVQLALEHLLDLGHRDIGYLGEFNSDVRYQAFCSLLKQKNIDVNPCFVKRGAERFENGGYQLARELLKEKKLPSAVVACYDQIAYGAMRAFRECGIRIPEDISVIGFDNIVMDDFHPIALTSVTNPVEQMGITAVKILIDAINYPETHVVQNVALQSSLVVRNSTCPPVTDRQE